MTQMQKKSSSKTIILKTETTPSDCLHIALEVLATILRIHSIRFSVTPKIKEIILINFKDTKDISCLRIGNL